MNLTFSSPAVFSSAALMGREASLMSVRSPLSASRNFLNPPPVPEMPTVTSILGSLARNISAAAMVIGATVLEPSTLTRPAS